jgi:glucose-6-phosphate 1-dehydrogenase
MLLPSLYGLDSDGLLADQLRIVATARSQLDDAGFCDAPVSDKLHLV